jgi:hypothetical protein
MEKRCLRLSLDDKPAEIGGRFTDRAGSHPDERSLFVLCASID